MRAFLEIARDPRVIPGVHHYCDEWCACCALTSRCLAFRCTEAYRKEKGRAAPEPPFRTSVEMIDRVYGHLAQGAEEAARAKLDAAYAKRLGQDRASAARARCRARPSPAA